MFITLMATVVIAPAARSLVYQGQYVEGCSCAPPCPCEITGVKMGCQGVGGFSVQRGSYEGRDISGTRFAYAVEPGSWIVLYIDAPDKSRREALTSMAKRAFKDWGKMAPIQNAKISIKVTDGESSLSIGGGKIMNLVERKMVGGDKKNALTFSNINSVLHPVVKQGKVVTCSYNDLGHSFTLTDTNAYYNTAIRAKGVLP